MPFTKGDSNINRKGQPKREWTWSGVLQTAVEKVDETGKTVKELVADSMVKEATRGNVVAQKELMNRMDGMPSQDIKQTGTVTYNVRVVRHPVK